MKRAALAVGITVLTFASVSIGHAQQQIEWKQVVNQPKGLNLPKDAKVDILGIDLGDSYSEAKAKLQRLLAEVQPAAKPAQRQMTALEKLEQEQNDIMSGAGPSAPIREIKRIFRINMGSTPLTATYVGEIQLSRQLQGSGSVKIDENISVWLSAPSSGHQVIGIERHISYRDKADQPKISEVMQSVQGKLRGRPQVYGNMYRFQFDDGRIAVPPGSNILTCPTAFKANVPDHAKNANAKGDCDVVLEITFQKGISPDHAAYIKFVLSDNERTRINVGADFAYFRSYVQDLQSRSKGVAPKL